MQQADILAHGLPNAGTLHLHRRPSAIGEHRSVHLSHGRGSQGLLLKGGEQLFQGQAELCLHRLPHLGKGHGLYIHPQGRQLLAIGRGQHIHAHGHDLPQLYKGGAQVLHHGPQLLGRQALGGLVFGQHAQNFPEPAAPGVILPFHPAVPALPASFSAQPAPGR